MTNAGEALSYDDETIEISPSRSLFNFREIWRYRELLYFLIWRDIRVRYKQTVLGVLWALLQPIGLMIIFSLFLGQFAHVPSAGVPYPLMVLAGLLPWQLFARAMNDASTSIVGSERLITKIYFPRMIVPAAAVGAALPDFLIGFCALLALLPYYHVGFGAGLLLAPVFILLAVITAFAVSLWLSALNVQYRDVGHVLGFLTQAWLFVTPVVYPLAVVPNRLRHIYALNPMVGVVEGFRRAVVATQAESERLLLVSVAAAVVVLVGGLIYFHRMEQTFADVI